MMSDDEDWSNYETGPFCRHWSHAYDCDKECKACGHKCTEHYFGDDSECMIVGCSCTSFADDILNTEYTPDTLPSKSEH